MTDKQAWVMFAAAAVSTGFLSKGEATEVADDLLERMRERNLNDVEPLRNVLVEFNGPHTDAVGNLRVVEGCDNEND